MCQYANEKIILHTLCSCERCFKFAHFQIFKLILKPSNLKKVKERKENTLFCSIFLLLYFLNFY